MCASHYGLTNLCAIVDKNGLQIDGPTRDVMNIDPLGRKFHAFGWAVVPVQGHSFPSLLKGFAKADTVRDRPQVLIARTVKGKGVSFMENNAEWHGIAPKKEQYEKAVAEIRKRSDKKKRR
jgi:transketolase